MSEEAVVVKQVKEIKKVTLGMIFSWIFGVFLVIGGLLTISTSIVSGIIYFIIGLYILPPLNSLIVKKTGIQFSGTITAILVIIALSVAALVGPKPITTNSSNQTVLTSENKPSDTTPKKAKEGDVIEGVDRKEIEDIYTAEKSKSSVKADAYVKTLEGKKVVWVGTIKDVQKDLMGSYNNISFKMGAYNNYLADKLNKYSDLEKGQTVKITGTIDRVTTFIGTDVYLTADKVEIIK